MPIHDKAILKSIADSLLPLIISYQKADNEQIKKWYKSIIKLGCRHLELFIEPYVSVKATLTANEMGIDDISCYRWNHQKSLLKDPKREIFHLEHVMPVSQIFEELIALATPCTNEIIGIISKTEIAWILKLEDRELNSKGYRCLRPSNAWSAYKDAGIFIEGKSWDDFGVQK